MLSEKILAHCSKSRRYCMKNFHPLERVKEEVLSEVPNLATLSVPPFWKKEKSCEGKEKGAEVKRMKKVNDKHKDSFSGKQKNPFVRRQLRNNNRQISALVHGS